MFEWLRPKQPENATLKEPEWWRQTANIQPNDAGVTVNFDTAMQVSAVFACVRILAESIGSLPLKIYTRRSDGGKEIAINHPLTRLFSGVPNEEMTPQELIEFIIASASLRGTAYSEIIRNGRGEPIQIVPLEPACVKVDRDSMGQLRFMYEDKNGKKVLSSRDIWRVPGLSGDGVTGYSTIAYARQSLGTTIATERHAAKTFKNGTRIAGVFETDEHLSDEAFDRLRNELNAYQGVDNANKTMILESGLKYQSISMTNDDAQFLESRKFQIAEIARWFRVPLHLLNELDKATFSNIEHQSLEFVMHTLRPWCKRIEHTITRDLIRPEYRGRVFAEFTLDALLRGDTKSRYEAHAIALGNTQTPGWATVNEIRKMENLNPVPGFDEIQKPTITMGGGEEQDEEAEQDAEQALARINSKEISAIQVEFNRLQPDEFDAWLDDFYGRMAEELAEETDKDTANQWANHRKRQVLEAANVGELCALLEQWENK